MAGGEGTRLRPLTSNAPKPMMALANRPMMEHVVDLLRRHGFDEIVVTVAYMADSIRKHFGDGSEFGVKMTYATEESPLGTAGSVRNAMDELDDTFLVISGDVLTDVDLTSIVDAHRQRNAAVTIGLVSVENPLEFGIVVTREDGSIERFLEKPTWGEVFTDTINTGIYVLEPSVFDWIEPDVSVDFSSDVFPKMLAAGEGVYGAVATGYWEDVGTLDAYLGAHKDILDQLVVVELEGFERQKGVWVSPRAEVHPEAVIEGPALIGENCVVDAGTRIGQYVVLGAGVRVGSDCDLERSVVLDNAYIDDAVRLRGAVVGRASDLRRGVRCDEGVVLGDEVFGGDEAHIGGDVKVYPFKTVEARAVVNSSIIWESKGARSLFGSHGVVGLANVDMTPELATKVALALATTLDKDATMVVSRDSSRSARMLKRAMMAGLTAGGIDILDLEVASLPVTRFVSRMAQVSAGLSIRLVDRDPNSVAIRFFDSTGVDITPDRQRKIERVFDREDFRRVRPGDIGNIDPPPRAMESYAVALEQTVDVGAIAERRFKLVVDYAYGSVSLVMPNVLAKLGADILALNPYASTAGVVDYRRDERAAEVSRLVMAAGADLGAVIDPTGEQLTLVDDTGRVLDTLDALLVMIDLVRHRMDGKYVALPVAAPRVAAELLEAEGLGVRWTKMTGSALMEASAEPDVGFAADLEGGFIIPGFMPAFDGAASMLKMLDLLAHRGEALSVAVGRVPELHVHEETVVTPWESKGAVMRTLMEQVKGRETDLVDGVKVFHDNGWVLMLPDPEQPLTHVIAEADSDDASRRLVAEYVRRVEQLQR